MAKINDIISAIEQHLENKDLSSSARGKQLADEYAAICEDLNKNLEECKNLFKMGAYSEARRLNLKAKPPLTERFVILNFPKRQEWCKLCGMYSWPIPPALDSETAKMLSSADTPRELSIEELQNRWRKIIREGSVQEKLILARKIYALDHTSVWRANLLNVERPFVNELIKKADAALEDNNIEELADLYNELVSPELLQKVPSDTLDKYRESVMKFNTAKIEKEKNAILDDIAQNYLAMNLAALEKSLSNWAAFKSNPLFSATPAEEQQVAEAKNFMLSKLAEANAEAQFNALQNQLELLLNEDGSFREIDRTYHSLQQLDRPIKKLLEERMHDFYERHAENLKRKHIRSCIAWGTSALVVAALIFSAIFYIQSEKELRDACSGMEQYIKENNFSTAIEYYKDTEKKNPSLAERARLKALYDDALKKYEQAIAAEKEFNKKASQLKSEYFVNDNVNNPAIEDIFKELEQLALILPLEKKNEIEHLRSAYSDAKSSFVAKQEIAFRDEILRLQREWNHLFNTFNKYRIADANRRRDELDHNGRTILNKYKNIISENLYKQWENNLAENVKSFSKHERNRNEIIAKSRNLYSPVSPASYFEALRKDLNISTEIANDFSRAMNQLSSDEPLYQILSINPEEKALRAIANQYLNNPYCREINRVAKLPQSQYDFAANQNKLIKNLSDKILNDYKVYELTMRGNNLLYHFYFDDPSRYVEVEYNRSKDRIKSLSLSFLHSSNKIRHNAVFAIDMSDVKKIAVEKAMLNQSDKKKNKKRKTKITPESALQAMDIKEQVNFMKLTTVPNQKFDTLPQTMVLSDPGFLLNKSGLKYAAHYEYLKNLLTDTKTFNTETICALLLQTAYNKDITNFYAKINLLQNLLQLLPIEKTPLYAANLGDFKKLVDSYAAAERTFWHNPAALHKYPTDAAEFEKKLNALNLKMSISRIIISEKMSALCLSFIPIPVGVLYKQKNNSWKLHSFRDTLANLDNAFIIGKNEAGTNCRISIQVLNFTNNLPHNKLPKATAGTIYNGQLVYSPFGMKSWQQEFKNIINYLQNNNYPVPADDKNIIWPECWPANLRNIREMSK